MSQREASSFPRGAASTVLTRVKSKVCMFEKERNKLLGGGRGRNTAAFFKKKESILKLLCLISLESQIYFLNCCADFKVKMLDYI